MTMSIFIREMTADDLDRALALWQSVGGIGLSRTDSRSNIMRFLERNPGFSFTAWDGAMMVGAVLCGHDGRRGYIHHLAVPANHRRRGLGRRLVERCLTALSAAGIDKCHLFVFADNQDARAFWADTGWTQRDDLVMMSHFCHS